MKKYKKFIAFTILGVAAAHVIFSVLLSLFTSSLYDNRMINIRHADFDRGLPPTLIAPFILDNLKNDERENLVIVGSSFSWGFPFPKSETLSFHLQKTFPDKKITNISVLADSPVGTLRNLCLLKNLGVHIDTLIVEIGIANFAERKTILKGKPRRCPEKENFPLRAKFELNFDSRSINFMNASIHRLSTLSSGVHQLTLSVDDVSDARVGSYLEIQDKEGGENFSYINGRHKIISIRKKKSQVVLEVHNKKDSMPQIIPGQKNLVLNPDVYGDMKFMDEILPYSFFFLRNPFGLKHFNIIHDEFDYPRSSDREYLFLPVADGYFNTPSEAKSTYEAKKSVLIPLLESSKDIASRVIFYIAPISAYGISQSQYKMDDISAQIESLLSICKEVGGIECLDTNFDIDKSLFMNITHLNMTGHKFFAGYLADVINKKEPRSLSGPFDASERYKSKLNIDSRSINFMNASIHRLSTLSSGVHQLTLSVDDVSDARVGSYLEIQDKEGGENFSYINGRHKIISIRKKKSQVVLEVHNKKDSMPQIIPGQKNLELDSISVRQLGAEQ